MKNIITLATLALLLISCGSKDAQSTETVLENNDATAMQAKKDELIAQQETINNQIKQLDEKLKELNPEKNIPLITAFEAKAAPFNHFLELQGSVETDENIVVTPEMGGVLRRVLVKEGDNVRKGQLLAVVDDGGMGQQLAQMQVQAELAKTTFERQKRLWDQKIGSEIQYLQAKSNYEGQQKAIASMQQQVGKANVRAPFSGIIDDVITEQGSVVSPGQTQLMRIVNLSDMYITTDVPESYLSDVENGKNVEVFFPVLNKRIDTKIRQTGNYINPNNRTFKIEIAVPNKDKAIKPNLTARLKINDYTNEKAIMIPQDIISENADGNQYVYVLNDVEGSKAVAEKKIITTGKTQGDVIEVIEGLSDGDQLIQEGARSVKEGQTVKIITY